MCAVGIDARELQIWKEVDGVFTADPSKVNTARVLATVTSEEAAELTYFGSEVRNSSAFNDVLDQLPFQVGLRSWGRHLPSLTCVAICPRRSYIP